MKKSKQNYFTKYFESNIKKLKNTGKELKASHHEKVLSLAHPIFQISIMNRQVIHLRNIMI